MLTISIHLNWIVITIGGGVGEGWGRGGGGWQHMPHHEGRRGGVR